METQAVDWKQAKKQHDRRFLSYQYDEVAGREQEWRTIGQEKKSKIDQFYIDLIENRSIIYQNRYR